MTCKELYEDSTDNQINFAKRLFGEKLKDVIFEGSNLSELAKNALLTARKNCK